MKKYLAVLLTSLLLLLSACSTSNDAEDNTEASVTEETNKDTSDTTESNNEASDLEKENEELKQQLAEKENEELKKKLEEYDDDEETSNIEEKEEVTTSSENAEDNTVSTAKECVINLLKDCTDDFTYDELADGYEEARQEGSVVDLGGGSFSLEYVAAALQFHDEYGELPDAFDLMDVTEEEFQIYEGAITEYLQRLANYYNYDDYDNIFYYLKEGSPAYNKVVSNKESGNFEDHITETVVLLHVENTSDGLVKLNANRVYEHKTSNGPHITNVDYYMDPETFEIIDYEALLNEPY